MGIEDQLQQAYLTVVMTLNQLWIVIEPTAKPLFNSAITHFQTFYQQQSQDPDPIKILIAIAIAIISLIVIVQQIMAYIIFGSILSVIAYILYIIFHHRS